MVAVERAGHVKFGTEMGYKNVNKILNQELQTCGLCESLIIIVEAYAELFVLK